MNPSTNEAESDFRELVREALNLSPLVRDEQIIEKIERLVAQDGARS